MLEELEIVHVLCLKLLISLSSPFLMCPSLLLGRKSNRRKARPRIQYHRSRESHVFYKIQNPRAITMTFRVIIPVRIRKTDSTSERFSERINRERLSVSTALPAHTGVAEPLFLFLTHKKWSHRREVTYGIAYYTGIIPAGPIRDFSASVWSSLFLSSSFAFSLSADILPSAQERTNTCIHVCAHVSPTEIFFSTECSRFWSRVSGDATEEDED